MRYFFAKAVLLFSSCGMIGGLSNHSVCAQGFGTVQLPTFQRLSMSTSALVPDQGTVAVGGMRNSRSMRGRGLRSGSGGASGVSISVFVHDLEAMDEDVIEQGRQARLRKGLPLVRPVERTSSRTVPQTRPAHIRDVRRRTESRRAAERTRARSDYALAQRLAAKGKYAAARIMLKNAQSRADESLRLSIAEQLAALDRMTW